MARIWLPNDAFAAFAVTPIYLGNQRRGSARLQVQSIRSFGGQDLERESQQAIPRLTTAVENLFLNAVDGSGNASGTIGWSGNVVRIRLNYEGPVSVLPGHA